MKINISKHLLQVNKKATFSIVWQFNCAKDLETKFILTKFIAQQINGTLKTNPFPTQCVSFLAVEVDKNFVYGIG